MSMIAFNFGAEKYRRKRFSMAWPCGKAGDPHSENIENRFPRYFFAPKNHENACYVGFTRFEASDFNERHKGPLAFFVDFNQHFWREIGTK